MTTHATLTAADIDAIARQIGDGAAALDSWSRQAAGGFMRPDDAREYWAHLPYESSADPWRVARVTVYRDAPGRWRMGDVDVFERRNQPEGVTIAADQAGEIIAAAGADNRHIVRDFEHVAPH